MHAIGQLMLDVEGKSLTPNDQALIRQPEVGGIILFGRNVESPEQVRTLTDSIRAIKPNILIAVDQEGGRVARFRQGFSPLPAMGQLGELFDHDPINALALALASGYLMASEVLAVGVDFSFAPVLDMNGVSAVIGDRAFHTHPLAITALSAQFMHGMKAAGMATTGKHFPGHGSVAPDSHHADAHDDRTFEAIYQQDMQPFMHNIGLLDALMPAHVVFRQVDDKPAGFSTKWVKGIIREQLGFGGVVFSDDLSMKAAHVAGDAGDRLAAALSAGCDMGLVCNDREAAQLALIRLQSEPSLADSNSGQRLAIMKAVLPTWRGTLTQTMQNDQNWLRYQHHVQQHFFA